MDEVGSRAYLLGGRCQPISVRAAILRVSSAGDMLANLALGCGERLQGVQPRGNPR